MLGKQPQPQRRFGSVSSAKPRELDRADLAQNRSQVLERPLLTDLPFFSDPIDIDCIPLHPVAAGGDTKQVAGVYRGDEQSKRHEIIRRDHVLYLRMDVVQRSDETTEDGDDGVHAVRRTEGTPIPDDVVGEV